MHVISGIKITNHHWEAMKIHFCLQFARPYSQQKTFSHLLPSSEPEAGRSTRAANSKEEDQEKQVVGYISRHQKSWK